MSNKTAPQIDATTGVRADTALVPPSDVPDFDDPAALPLVRRSDLERYATCPAQARFVELGRVMTTGRAAAVGQEVHEAFSAATDEYVQAAGALNAADLADVVRGRLLNSRPDLQPDVIDAAWRCAWPWAKFLDSLNPANVKRYDGGKGERSGQLAWDIPHLGCRVTSELDFLYVTDSSKTVIHAVDYKSGWTSFDVKKIAGAFQFQTHAWLVLNNYPVDEFNVQIWRTRSNDLSPPVTFTRADLDQYHHRIVAAATLWAQHRHALPETCIAHPTVEGCELCPAKHLCPVVPLDDVDSDPPEALRRLWALDTKCRDLEKKLQAVVERTGVDIVTEDGMAFGFDKPAAERKATAKLYSTK